MAENDDWQARFQRADRQVLDQIRQKQEAAASLLVVEEMLVGYCQHATHDNADLRSALLELRIVRSTLDQRPAAVASEANTHE